MDSGQIAKKEFHLGVILFVIGMLGEIVGHLFVLEISARADQFLLGMETVGGLLALFVPIIFGAVLPLID